ncbi:YfiR family protein [Neptunomonas sp.]|uniref:YfiR family protein n=1 Tax=Neptunomonas sp. TaxID=1971898 RepID=UPI00356AEC93
MGMLYSRLNSIFRRLLLSGLLAASMLTVSLLTGKEALADGHVVDNIKTVYIYNFLSFIQWPEHKSTSAEYRLCTLADQALVDKLTAVVKDEQMNGRSLIVVPYRYVSEAENCHLIYLQESALSEADSLLDFDQPGTLLIGDADGFVSGGMGMVGFETRGRKVRVAMNLTRLQEAGFKVSSKLLRLVRIER